MWALMKEMYGPQSFACLISFYDVIIVVSDICLVTLSLSVYICPFPSMYMFKI